MTSKSTGFRRCSLSSLLENRTIGRHKVPVYVLLLSLFAATGGLMFGYDIGISGGVTVMEDFLYDFFPTVWVKKKKYLREAEYCLFGDQKVQLFTSCLYLAAMVSTFFAVYVSRQWGLKRTINLASCFYLFGVLLNIVSGALPHPPHHSSVLPFCILIFGRISLGFGVGFGNLAIPLFISEIAPLDARGALNHLFQLNVTLGILFANIVNWKAQNLHPWGWRLSLGLAGIPALLFMIGSFFLVETPCSFVQRGRFTQAKEVLKLTRGQGVDPQLALQDIKTACNVNIVTNNSIEENALNDSINGDTSSMQISNTRFHGLFARSNRPPLVIAIFVQFFQQFTGINVVILYATVLFNSLGSKTDESLRFALIIGGVNVAFTFFSIFMVDRIGRQRLLIGASIVMFVTQISIGIILIGMKKAEGWRKKVVEALVCTFVSAFACSWGPLAWLISTEIFPLVCRYEGQSVTVFFNMLFTFLIAHIALTMLCTLKFGIFFFFGIWAFIMGSFSFFILPETMNMEMEAIQYIWSYHKFWKHFVTPSTHVNPRPPQVLIPASSPSPNSPPQHSCSNVEMI